MIRFKDPALNKKKLLRFVDQIPTSYLMQETDEREKLDFRYVLNLYRGNYLKCEEEFAGDCSPVSLKWRIVMIMHRSLLRIGSTLPLILLLLYSLSACNAPGPTRPATPVAPSLTSTPFPGSSCLQQEKSPYQNIQVSRGQYQAYSEPMLAQNPKNPLHLVGGSKFFTDLARYRFQVGAFSSFDGGCTWQEGGVIPGFTDTLLTSDPTFAFGINNEVYAAYLFSGTGAQGENGIAVSTSVDGGKTFDAPVIVHRNKTAAEAFDDKPWIAVDHSGGKYNGTIYIAWSYDHNGECGAGNFCSEALGFSRSIDNGKTFSLMRTVEGNAPFCTNRAKGRPLNSTRCDAVQGVVPVVLPDGTLVIATPYIDLMSGPIPTRLIATTSPDHGNTWTPPVLIATIRDIAGNFPPDRYRNISLPALACDPRTGQLYITWADKRNGDADILLATSTDKGKSWSSPLRVNDDPLRNNANQFQPQLAVAPNGVVSISFFDTRLDARHRLIDLYLAQSIDKGKSFLKNMRITTQSWNPAIGAPTDLYGSQFIGDYQGLTADNAFVHPFWNETRTGRQDIFTAAIPSARPPSG
jgi:hypothetical protein